MNPTHEHRRPDEGVTDEELAARIAETLDGRTVATAESVTAGRIAEAFASVDKASEFFRGGVVAYQEPIKRDILGVTAESVVTARAAEQMARGVARHLHADVAVSTTGVAGDEPVDGTPPGTVFVGLAVGPTVTSTAHHFSGSPPEICDQARRAALLDLIHNLDRARAAPPRGDGPRAGGDQVRRRRPAARA